MRRISRKKLKLAYIREKNHYRRGGLAALCLTVDKSLINDPIYYDRFVESEIQNEIDDLNHLYKMNFKIIKTVIGYDLNSFMDGLVIVKTYLKAI